MNGPYSISNFFILLLKTYFIASKLQLYIAESVTLLNCHCNVFWPCVAIIVAAAIKKDCSYKSNGCIWLFFFLFLYSAIPDLELGILKMLIRVCFRDVSQPAVYWFVPSIIWFSTGLYSKCTVFTINLCYYKY